VTRSATASFRGTAAVVPAVSAVLFVLVAGLGATVLQSTGLMPLFGEPRLTLGAYGGIDGLARATWLSLLIATASTVVAAAVGLVTALAVVNSRIGARLMTAVVTTSIPVPHLVGAASFGLLLADGGLVTRWLGIPTDAWPSVVGGQWPTAVVLEYAWKESAFIALVVTAALATRLASFQETAQLLGARPWARLRHVTLPLAAPALLASSAITFVYTLGSYEVAWLLGPAYPEPLPVMAYRLFTTTDLSARPEAMAVAVLTTVLSAGAALIALSALRRSAGWR
jgi:putative spermidine/putrescine transport system permease protein